MQLLNGAAAYARIPSETGAAIGAMSVGPVTTGALSRE